MESSISEIQKLSDEDLARRCRTELPYNTQAFEEIVRRYEPIVFGTCRKIVGNCEDAQELAQDVFMKLFHKIEQFEGRSTFKTWLFRVVNNTAIRKRQLDRRRSELWSEFADGHIRDREEALEAESLPREGGVVMDALEHLTDDERQVIWLKLASELEFNEIAEVIGLSLSAAKMRYYRALESYQAEYERVHSEQPAETNEA